MAALAGIKQIQSREQLLTNVARPIMKVDVNKELIAWLSDHEFLCVTTIKEEAEIKDQKGAQFHQIWQGSADVLNTTAHSRKHLTGLANWMNTTQKFPTREQGGFTFSPDHASILWNSFKRNGPYQSSTIGTNISCLDGTQARTWEEVPPGMRTFLDSRHLAYIVRVEKARIGQYPFVLVIYDLQNPSQDKTLLDPVQVEAAITPITAREYIRVNEEFRADVGDASSVAIETYRLNDAQPLQRHLITLPAGAELKSAYVSPQQQLVLYHLIISQTSPILTWLHRLVPGFACTPTRSAELWFSRADGQGMHEIGHEPYTMLSQYSLADRLEEIQWLPNGKQVSVTYQGKLYVVSAEPSP